MSEKNEMSEIACARGTDGPRPSTAKVRRLTLGRDAASFLDAAGKHLKDRATSRDQPDGERSMARTVAAFNQMFGTELSEAQGWSFMALLKMSRASQGAFTADDYEDGAAYFALAGEAAYEEKNRGPGGSALAKPGR